MPSVKLDARTVANIKTGEGQRLELWDLGKPGLCLRVSGNSKAWFYRYRAPDGRQPRLKLGDYSKRFGLADARDRVDELKVAIKAGKDPAAELRAAKLGGPARDIQTFDDLVQDYFTACETGLWQPKRKRKRARTLKGEKDIYRLHVKSHLGSVKLAELKRVHIRNMLKALVAKGLTAGTRQAHALCKAVLNYAIAEDYLESNVALAIAPMVGAGRRERVLTDDEIKLIWNALENASTLTKASGRKAPIGRPMAIALQLLLLLLQRRGEVAGMMTSELDLDQRLWLLPGERTKSGRPQLVPLPPLAVSLIGEAMRLASKDAKPDDSNEGPVFPSPRDPAKAMRADSVTHALRVVTDVLEISGVAPHDLRRTGSTALTSERIGVSHFIRSQVIGHSSDAGGGAAVSSVHYDANSYVKEKRDALEKWEALLRRLVD